MKRQLGRIAAGLMVLVVFALLPGSLRAQGNFVYTNDYISGSNTVSGFSVASNGTLTPVLGSPFPTGGTRGLASFIASNNVTVSTVGGNFLFASNGGSNDVSVFSINASTGTLSLVAGSPFPTGGSGSLLGISLSATSDGRFLMAGNSGSVIAGFLTGFSITVFSIASNGALTPIVGSPFPTLASPDGVKVSPDGKFLAVAENDDGKNDVAIRRLDSFINEVNDLLSSGVLSPSQAASLVAAAQSVIAAL